MRKILTTNTQLILGNSTIKKLEFSFEDRMFLASLSMNIPVPNMVLLTSIKFSKYQYVNGIDDAVFYYPLLEHTGGTQKSECRKLGIRVDSATVGVIELQYTGAIPIGYFSGMMFNFIASIETINTL